MGMAILSIICSFVAYLIGAVIEITSTANFPGLGVALSVITMGAFIMFRLRKSGKDNI